jgi:polar amino acid transport system substrate-binding protein
MKPLHHIRVAAVGGGIVLAAFGLLSTAAADTVKPPPQTEPTVYILNTSTGAPYATPDRQGFLDLLVAEAFKRIGLKGEVALYAESKRALINANDDIDQGVAMRVQNLEKNHPNLVRVPERVIGNDFVAYARDLDVVTDSWETLKPYAVTHIHGWVIFERNMPEGQDVVTVKEPAQMFSMLDKKRVDMALYERWQGLQFAKDQGLKVNVLEPPLASVDMFMYVHKKYAHLVDKLDGALKAMKADGTYQAIFERTLTPLLPSRTMD